MAKDFGNVSDRVSRLARTQRQVVIPGLTYRGRS